MKYVFLTNANNEGVSEVFHTLILPEDLVPEGMIDRWNTLVSSSPIVARVLQNKENVAIGSTWNEQSGELTLREGLPLDMVLPTESMTYAFFVDNVMTAGINAKQHEMSAAKFTAAFSEPIIVVSVSDDSEVENGYTYSESVFTPPVEA
jgi:hypothetical protein